MKLQARAFIKDLGCPKRETLKGALPLQRSQWDTFCMLEQSKEHAEDKAYQNK